MNRQVDRTSRDKLADCIEHYLNDEITAFAFDEQIFQIHDATSDATVQQVAGALWYHYDDCEDHKVVLSKEEWDYFQRLLLVLKSDANLEVRKSYLWSFSQLIAAAGVLAFVWCVFQVGFGNRLFLYCVPLGFLSLLLSWARAIAVPEMSSDESAVTPFASVSQIRSVYRRAAGFSKRRYSAHLSSRMLRTPESEAILTLHRCVAQIVASPLVLAFQMLPVSLESRRVSL